MHTLNSMSNKKGYEIWKQVKDSWQKLAEKMNDEGIDNYNKKYHNNHSVKMVCEE